MRILKFPFVQIAEFPNELTLRWLGRGSAFAVTVAGSWLLAGLIWGFSLPESAPAVAGERHPMALAEKLLERQLFSVPVEPARVEIGDIRLLGVVASHDPESARAIIRHDNEAAPRVLAIGDDAGQGATLRRIDSEQIVLADGKGERILALPKPATPAAPPSKD